MPASPSRALGDTRRRPPDPTRRVAGSVAMAACLLAGSIASAVADDTAPLPATPVSALWTAVPLRAWARRATTLAGRPVVVDRRLDPEHLVSRDCRDEPLGAVLAAVATEAGGTVEPLASWIRIAPPAAAGKATRGARERAAELARLPAAARAVPAARRPWTWSDGARPRDLVASAAAEAGLALRGLEIVPHDHLAAETLPDVPLAERLDLVLAHYDLRVAWSADARRRAVGTVVPLEAAAARVPGDERPTAPDRAKPPPPGGERYTLRLAAPLDEALAALAPRLGLEAAVDRESLAARGILPGEIVRVAVTDATREQLLDALVAPLGLRWRIANGTLLVDAPP